MSQDAKFFQRGKIQVRIPMHPSLLAAAAETHGGWRSGVPPGTTGCRDEGQEVHEAKDGVEEDSREHHYGER